MMTGGAVLRPRACVGVLSVGTRRTANLCALLEADSLHLYPADRSAKRIDYVVGWGRKPSAERARAYAERNGLPYVGIEDGFLRSVGLGVEGAAPLSLVVDPDGMYYDATQPSRLEMLLEGQATDSDRLADPELIARAERAIAAIAAARLSKYNQSSTTAALPPSNKKRVLVVDQTAGDFSLRLGQAPVDGVRGVLEAALREHPNAEILLKTHPDATSGKRRSSAGADALPAGVVAITDPINPITLLQQVQHVYVATSQLGFEALMVGKPVTCFGAPFYAGWGLTDDRVSVARRTRARTLPEVFAAAYILYCRYLDPQTGRPGELEDVIAHLSRQRRMFADNARRHFCFGFARWKHAFARAYLRSPDAEIHFVSNAASARRLGCDADARLVVWGQRAGDDVTALAQQTGAELVRMEDGFLRSTQLGSDLTVPASLVLDRHGIYYDPRQPSDLERILQTETFEHEDLERAARLRQMVLSSRVSKYAFGAHRPVAGGVAGGRRVILVPGQVQTDASIRLGCPGIADNLALLQRVRAENPDAHVIFKPHPDVLSYNRRGGPTVSAFEAHCDELVTTVHISDCLDAADEVHTMTSLVGFEALLRGLRVVTYGQPFYSGWGLTEDRDPVHRRTRRLSLDALVAGTLLRYPRYVHPKTGEFVEAEAIVAYLAEGGVQAAPAPLLLRQLRRLARSIVGRADV